MMLKGIKNGWFPPLPDTGNRRSLIHVDDLVQALLLVAESEFSNGEIFIATGGLDYSSQEIYKAMCSAVGRFPPKWSVPNSVFQITAKFGDLIKNYFPFPFDSRQYQKLLGDGFFSCEKLKAIGFKPRWTLPLALPEMVRELKILHLPT